MIAIKDREREKKKVFPELKKSVPPTTRVPETLEKRIFSLGVGKKEQKGSGFPISLYTGIRGKKNCCDLIQNTRDKRVLTVIWR